MDFTVDLLKKKIAEYEEEVSTGNNETAKFHEKQVKILEKKLTDLDAKELALWEAQLDSENKMPSHILKSLTDKLAKEREETETALTKAREAVATPIDNEVKRVTLQNALDALRDDEISVAEKNRYLKACISRITYHREAPQRRFGKGSGGGYVIAPIELDVKMMF
jgi:predicted  nucleic acid-binding Zn-ribbon protein